MGRVWTPFRLLMLKAAVVNQESEARRGPHAGYRGPQDPAAEVWGLQGPTPRGAETGAELWGALSPDAPCRGKAKEQD